MNEGEDDEEEDDGEEDDEEEDDEDEEEGTSRPFSWEQLEHSSETSASTAEASRAKSSSTRPGKELRRRRGRPRPRPRSRSRSRSRSTLTMLVAAVGVGASGASGASSGASMVALRAAPRVERYDWTSGRLYFETMLPWSSNMAMPLSWRNARKRALPPASTTAISSSVHSSMVMERTMSVATPRPLCTPAQLMQSTTPWEMDAHCALGASHSKQHSPRSRRWRDHAVEDGEADGERGMLMMGCSWAPDSWSAGERRATGKGGSR